jgi:pyruvate/2-oxoglutarate dehydrogenase complex dihydrolipoamide acyltransferase (E2) component
MQRSKRRSTSRDRSSTHSSKGGRLYRVALAVRQNRSQEIGATASQEAKELGLAATRKAKELAERRRQRHVEKHDATPAAIKAADELDVALGYVTGSGAKGRITVRGRPQVGGGLMERPDVELRASVRPSAFATRRPRRPRSTSTASPTMSRSPAASGRTSPDEGRAGRDLT